MTMIIDRRVLLMSIDRRNLIMIIDRRILIIILDRRSSIIARALCGSATKHVDFCAAAQLFARQRNSLFVNFARQRKEHF